MPPIYLLEENSREPGLLSRFEGGCRVESFDVSLTFTFGLDLRRCLRVSCEVTLAFHWRLLRCRSIYENAIAGKRGVPAGLFVRIP